MTVIAISVNNESTTCTDTEVQTIVAALQEQVSRDWVSAWGFDARLTFVPHGQPLPPSAWWLTFFDNSDQAGALGYHDLTSTGLPLGKCFAATDKQYGQSISGTASHELLEMILDSYCNTSVQFGPKFYAYEACDPCEADQYGYDVNGTRVSDFVLPAYWNPNTPANTPTSFKGNLKGPCPNLLPGGYLSVFDSSTAAGWTQVNAQLEHPADSPQLAKYNYGARARVGSRRERRRTPFPEWQRSIVSTTQYKDVSRRDN